MLISLIAGFCTDNDNVFMVLFMGVFTVLSGVAFVPVSNAVFKLGLPVVALLVYIAICLIAGFCTDNDNILQSDHFFNIFTKIFLIF